MEGNFNDKAIKPTLDTPTSMGKVVDTNFKKEIRKSGMTIKEAKLFEEKEKKESLKKKIFKLDKMETLVHTDELLSKKFEEAKGIDPEIKWGYHWNEVILNILFNDFVLNSPKYLDKYKNTRAKEKTRRGEEGIKQLQNDLEKEKDASTGADERKDNLMAGSDNKEKVDELFGFGSKNMGTELPMNKRSKNDTYFVDTRNKKLVAPVPYNASPEEKQAIISKYVGNPAIKQLSWYNAVKQGIKGVPTEVSDGSIQAMDAEMSQKYPQGTSNMVSLAEDGIEETTSSSGSGQFTQPLSMPAKNDPIADTTYEKDLSETTTSSSSGQYSGPRIWAKNPKNARFANKTAWKGGEIVAESVFGTNKNYLTDGNTFKSYILKNEIVSMMNESFEMGEGETFQQHSEKMLAKLHQYAAETPELKNDPDFNDLIKITTQRAGKSQDQNQNQQQQNTNAGTTTKPTIPISEIGSDANSNYKEAMVKDLKYTGNPVVDNESADELESNDGLFKGRWNNNESVDDVSSNDTYDELHNEYYPKVIAALVKCDAPIELLKEVAHFESDEISDQIATDFDNGVTPEESANGIIKMSSTIEEGIFGDNNSELNIDQIASMIDNFKQSPQSVDFRNDFVKAKDYLKAKTGNVGRLPQLKMWLDQNMPQLSNYVGLLWGNWDLAPKLNESKQTMSINKGQYKEYLKKRLNETKSLKTLNENQKQNLLKKFHNDFINESIIDDQPDSMVNGSQTSMANTMNSDELNTDGQPIPNAVSGISPQDEGYDVDDMKSKGSLADKFADYSDEEPTSDDNDNGTDEPEMGTPEKPQGPSYYHSGSEDSETINDAGKFREMLNAKYGVDNVGALSPVQRQELMKSMNFGAQPSDKKSIDMDFSKFAASDADKAEYQARDQKRLDFIASQANSIKSLQDYSRVANDFMAQTGERMFHPMAILASIEGLPQNSQLRQNLSGVENLLKSQLTKKIAESLNEDRKVSAILNVEKLGAENAKNFKADSAKEDGLTQDKTYPKDDGIHKAPVWPDPSKFYIEQDLDKVQKEAKTMADIEKEVLAKTKGEAFKNVGDSTNEKGNEIPKRNMTKEESYALAMNRGLGMQDIVYDNKPSDRFEKRMEKDLGADVYKTRQDKMNYRADAPMYNKDTQPTETGDDKEQDNKFAKGYNNESVTSKYVTEFGRVNIFEFNIHDVTEGTLVEGAIKLSVNGLGNRYSNIKIDKSYNKTISENKDVNSLINKYDFYLIENKVIAVEKSNVIVESKQTGKGNVNESFNKMKHLMNYKPSTYVDGKKSVKF